MVKLPAPLDKALKISQLADSCVQCGLCIPHCPTYQIDRSEAESPRGRIAYMKAVATEQLAPSAKGDQHLDHCLGCRRCEAACPAHVEYGALLGLAREQQFLRKPSSLKQKLTALLLAKPVLLAVAGFLGRMTGHLPSLPTAMSIRAVPDFGSNKKVAIFAGCIANTYEANTRANLQMLLASIGYCAQTIASQTCCGTAAIHSGDVSAANLFAAKNRAAFTDNITVLTLATGCHEQLTRNLQSQNKVVDALDFIFQHVNKLKFKAANQHIALHIPCSQSTAVKSDNSTRQLLALIPALAIHELPDQGCCGAAGLHMLVEPERADALRQPLVDEISSANVTQLLSANIGCRLHMANGLKIPVRHPIDFLAEHLA